MKSFFKALFWLALLLGVAFLIGWAFLFEAATATDNSMAPNLIRGDSYLVYLHSKLAVGSPVLCADPRDETKRVAGRVVATAGDKVSIMGGSLLINGHQTEHTVEGSYVLVDDRNTGAPQTVTLQDRIETIGMIRYHIIFPEGAYLARLRNARETSVRDGSVYLMADNRAFGEDSRTYGQVKISSCIGRPLLVYKPAEVSGDAGSSSRWFSIIR
jgi:signal peptidase I